jgi:hypothetical protein
VDTDAAAIKAVARILFTFRPAPDHMRAMYDLRKVRPQASKRPPPSPAEVLTCLVQQHRSFQRELAQLEKIATRDPVKDHARRFVDLSDGIVVAIHGSLVSKTAAGRRSHARRAEMFLGELASVRKQLRGDYERGGLRTR